MYGALIDSFGLVSGYKGHVVILQAYVHLCPIISGRCLHQSLVKEHNVAAPASLHSNVFDLYSTAYPITQQYKR